MFVLFCLYILGPLLLEPGNFDCHLGCQKLNFICGINFKTGDSVTIFQDVGVNCSSNSVQSYWSEQYHPIYFPQDETCVGYINVPKTIQCNPKITDMSNELMQARRICNCVDPGNTSFTI